MAPGECTQVEEDERTCRWDFGYRDPAARESFETLSGQLERCAGPKGRMTDDIPVNHPDTYDLRIHAIDGFEVAVSLKDKAALGKSLIFLRSRPRAPE